MSNITTTTNNEVINFTLPSEIKQILQHVQQFQKFAISFPKCNDAVANDDVIKSADNYVTSVLCVANTIFADYINNLFPQLSNK